MAECSTYRSVEDRISWFLTHNPRGVGWCAQHTWHALGGNKTPACPPRWYANDANEVYAKAKAAGKLHTGRLDAPPAGAVVLWKYGKYGHMALSLGNGNIATTDPTGKPGGVGVEPINYPRKWGASNNGKPSAWIDYYAGTTFEVGKKADVDIFDYDFLGKPTKNQTVGRSYVKLTKSVFVPDSKGWENSLVYLNIKPTFKAGKTHGAMRIRLVRADGTNRSAYNDFPIDIDDLDNGGVTLRTYTYWELGARGVAGKTHFEIRCQGGLKSAEVSTRYTKKAVVKDDGV